MMVTKDRYGRKVFKKILSKFEELRKLFYLDLQSSLIYAYNQIEKTNGCRMI